MTDNSISEKSGSTPFLRPVPLPTDPASSQAAAERDIDIMARTIWGEARGEGAEGMEAVAHVILNRLTASRRFGGYWWGNTVSQICHKPYQFSCWNRDDPNYPALLRLDEKDIWFSTALRIARRAVLGISRDPTLGADHYHARQISPSWAQGKTPCAVIGRHVFYRLVKVPS